MQARLSKWVYAALGALLGAGLTAGLFVVIDGGHKNPPFPPRGLNGTLGESAREEVFPMALDIARAIRDNNFSLLSDWAHPDEGIRFTAFSTVDEEDPVFTKAQIAEFSQDTALWVWGVDPETSLPIRLTALEFFNDYLHIRDFAAASAVGFNTVLKTGNAPENVLTMYPGDTVVELYHPSEGNWASLKLVLEPYGGEYRLVGIVRSVYTLP